MKFNKKIDNSDLDNLVSKYSILNTEETDSISFKSRLNENLNDDLPSYAKNEYKPKSKIGYIKDNFTYITHINPIYRYNFIVDRYNEDINKYNKITLHKIPIHKYISKIFDVYIYICRLIFAIFLISLGICRKDNTYKNYLKSKPLKFENYYLIYIFTSFLGLFIICFLIYYFYFIVLIPNFLASLLCIYGEFYAIKNKNMIQNNFFRNMIFDPELDNTNKLNDYITIVPNNIQNYSEMNYYKILVFLYDKRCTDIPQQFMLYGKYFTYERDIIKNSLFLNLSSLIVISIIGSSFFFY